MLNIVIHGHFYQPPRENPVSLTIPENRDTYPFHDWNEKIYNRCYLPNSKSHIVACDGRIITTINNYKYMSFDIGPTLHKWISMKHPNLAEIIEKNGSRAMAQCYNHMIMPLASTEDKQTQILWGIKDFTYRYGRKPSGMWLPETAVDTETLEFMSLYGITYTILAPRQCLFITEKGTWRKEECHSDFDTTIPYKYKLPSGRYMNILFYDTEISQATAFGNLLDNGDEYFRTLITKAVDDENHILVVATDGESYGHHHKFGDMALARLFQLINKNPNINLINPGIYFENNPPSEECIIRENTSWSCVHGIERWRDNCGCSTGHEGYSQTWRKPLRKIFDSLREEIDQVYKEYVSPFTDPVTLRNNAIVLYLDNNPNFKSFIRNNSINATEKEILSIIKLIEAQRMRMYMYTSCAWFFNDISRVETTHAIECAVFSAKLTDYVTGNNLTGRLCSALESVKGNTQQVPTAASPARQFLLKNCHLKSNTLNNVRSKQRDAQRRDKVMSTSTGVIQNLICSIENSPTSKSIAYFSLEIGIRHNIPTYAGGLGILAGDILKSSADLGVPVLGMTLLYRKGYFTQIIDKDGRQLEENVQWDPDTQLISLPNKVSIRLEGRDVQVGVKLLNITGSTKYTVPIYFLDTDLEENAPEDRNITSHLYGGDNKYRLHQELILGIAGLRMLRDLGYDNIETFHLNEGHAGFITMELLRELGYIDIQKVKSHVVFTTHTPVAAGHDFFPYDMIEQAMGKQMVNTLKQLIGGDGLSMTDLARKFSRFVNGVSKKHAQVSQKMFNDNTVDWITNGVHSETWVAPSFTDLYDRHIPGWRNAPERFVTAYSIPNHEIEEAHLVEKDRMIKYISDSTGIKLDRNKLIIGFARRAATYKRATLLFSDMERLLNIASNKVQFVFAGKAHPRDEQGKEIIHEINKIAKQYEKKLTIAFIENYNMQTAKLLVSGVDLWLNTPVRPREASGTSGMKCVHNGIPNFSTLDGWWIEGYIPEVTGWAIGAHPAENDMEGYDTSYDVTSLYETLEKHIIPCYFNNRKKWIHIMKSVIAVNASYFNTHRVVREYCEKAYKTIFRGH